MARFKKNELKRKTMKRIQSIDDEPPLNITRIPQKKNIALLDIIEPSEPIQLEDSNQIESTMDFSTEDSLREEQMLLDEQLAKMLAEESEQEESEYEIEKIMSHSIFKVSNSAQGKVVQYEIKWKGYEENENTLETAKEIHNDVYGLCEKYWDDLGIKRPSNAPGFGKNTDHLAKKATKNAVKTRSANNKNNEELIVLKKTVTKSDTISMLDVPRCMAEKGFSFPISYPTKNTNWEQDLKEIATIQLSPVEKQIVLVYIEWKNGEKTIHTLGETRLKCPGILIDYFEARLKFV